MPNNHYQGCYIKEMFDHRSIHASCNALDLRLVPLHLIRTLREGEWQRMKCLMVNLMTTSKACQHGKVERTYAFTLILNWVLINDIIAYLPPPPPNTTTPTKLFLFCGKVDSTLTTVLKGVLKPSSLTSIIFFPEK